MKKVMMFVLAIMLSVFVTVANAEVKAGSFSVTPFIGGYVFEGNEYDLEDTYTAGLRAGYNFTENMGLEGFFSYIPTSLEDSTLRGCSHRSKDEDADLYYYGVEGIYHFMPESRLVPFLTIGLGGIHYGTDANEPEGNKLTVDYGAGLKFFVTDNIALRADVRHVLPLNERYNDLLYTVGINFAFGGGKKAAETKKNKETPPPAPHPAVIEKGRQTLDVKFDFDKAIIKEAYNKDIDNLVEVMKDYPDLNVVIEGHTDSVGTNAYNINLSQRRADAVKKYMVEKGGIDANRIETKGFGEERPVASNATKEGRLQNRRVEAVVDYIIKK